MEIPDGLALDAYSFGHDVVAHRQISMFDANLEPRECVTDVRSALAMVNEYRDSFRCHPSIVAKKMSQVCARESTGKPRPQAPNIPRWLSRQRETPPREMP